MLKIMTSREIDASKMRYNTRVGTGKARHAQKIDTRTLWGRRDREIYNAIISDLGGADRLLSLSTKSCAVLSAWPCGASKSRLSLRKVSLSISRRQLH